MLGRNLTKYFTSSAQTLRYFSEAAKKAPKTPKTVVLLPGDGIGPEITESVIQIFDHQKIPIIWERHQIYTQAVTKSGDLISDDTIEAIKLHGYGLKGPFATPIGKGHRSLNVTLRKRLQLYANVRPCKTIKGVKGLPHDNLDVVTIRENTEGEYSGLEHEVVPGVVENLKIISKFACENIAKYAFEYAKKNGRKEVCCVHKAGVMVMGDGCFVDTCREVAQYYPEIDYVEKQVDTMSMKLTRTPQKVDVMVMPNLYGDIISDLCAGLIGGLGQTSSGNIGEGRAVYEAVHGSAPDIAGKNLANPTALILSACMMLNDMGFTEESKRIQDAVHGVIADGKWVTRDLGGKAMTTDYTKAILEKLV